MELTPVQYKEIEQLAAVNYSVKQIAMCLDVNLNAFLKEFNNPDSKIRYHYDRGLLITRAEIDKANLKRARDGNLTSIQQWKKDAHHQKIENIKKKVFLTEEKSEYEQLQGLIERGETKNLPANVVQYYEQVDFIRCLHGKYESKSFIINAVTLQWPNLTKHKATQLYFESLNFFNLDNPVKVEAWANIYADRMDQMAMICYEMGDMETWRRMTMDAAQLRGVGKDKPNEIPDALLDRRPVLYTIHLRDLGIEEVNRNDLAAFIDSLDITERQKTKYKREGMVEDVPFELMEDGQE
jgi:hypothetical protein